MLIHICMRDVARIEMHVLIMKYMEHRFDALAVARNSRMRDGSVHWYPVYVLYRDYAIGDMQYFAHDYFCN